MPKATGGQSPADDGSQHTIAASVLNALLAANPTQTYTVDIIDSNHGGWGWTVVDDVTIPGNIIIPVPPYNSWAATKGLFGPATAFNADPDHDGVPNGIDFVLGGEPNPANPNANSSPQLPTGEVLGDDFVFTFLRQDDAAYLNPTVEFDADLVGPWTTAVHGTNATIQVTNGTPADTVMVTIPGNGAMMMFARLAVAEPAP
ncbi:MAG: hypothetical protein NTW21_19015 [Verrucomicrobia bacterium]|nr:hypothetical protein [Verrucomicrobiota bacterium]